MIDAWIQELVGKPYVDGASGPDAFYCAGLAKFIYEREFGEQLPDTPALWRQKFNDIGWPVELEKWDLIMMRHPEADNPHMGILVDTQWREVIHAWRLAGQVVLMPVTRLIPYITTVMRRK